MRNRFQTMIDKRHGHKPSLVGLHNFVAEYQRSQYDALLAAPEGSDERKQLAAEQAEIKEVLKQIDKLCGW